MNVIVKDGQTLADIAIQEYGAFEALPALALANGLALSDIPTPGTALTLPEAVYNRTMQQYCKARSVSPATARDNSGLRLGIFARQFQTQFQ